MLRPRNHSRRRGHAIVEVSLMAPWIFFLCVGALDFGFYSYAAICTENAARVAVQQTSIDANSAASSATACTYALGEMKSLPNMNGVTTCQASAGSISSSQPLAVVATLVNPGADGTLASSVTVTYQTTQMIAIPGLMASNFTLVRTAQMRLREQ
ncbi:MAG TPA: TadE family protein [Bryobacteraceae bacterium]|nr:TadE family protein [Bryobacteraceae bacterium]